jgi:hypothetical protein
MGISCQNIELSGGERGTRTLDLGIMSATKTQTEARLGDLKGPTPSKKGYAEHGKSIPLRGHLPGKMSGGLGHDLRAKIAHRVAQ